MVSIHNSQQLHSRSIKSIPGGVNSPVRAFKAVGGSPLYISKASGCYLWDADGNKYIDFIGSWGPMIVGHAEPSIVHAIKKTAESGSSFGVSTELEIDLAEEIKQRMPSIELVRFVNSGTEAVMSAIRLARAYTGWDKIVKFDGGYHGHCDSFLVAAGSGGATLGLPDSPGVTAGSSQDTLIATFNDIKSVHDLFFRSGDQIAAVVIEPVAGNMGVIPPEMGFLNEIRKLCDHHGTLLIFDEVMTGFRVAKGGAQELYGVKPDLTMLGKIIGGGLPVGAFGGRKEIMEQLAPLGAVYQAGTLSGNPLAMAAGLATLKLLTDSAYRKLESNSSNLERGIAEEISQVGCTGVVNRVGSMLTLFFSEHPIRNFSDAKKSDHALFSQFFREMLNQGTLLPPSGYESWFISLAHEDETINETLKSIRSALRNVSSNTPL